MTPISSSAEDIILNHHSYGSGEEKVLVLHSWIDSASSFDNVKQYLDGNTFTYVFADLRSYGGSSNITGNYNSLEAAEDAMRLADKLGWDKFHIIGHSMSGMIVQRVALEDWIRGSRRLKSVIGVTPVSADGYPADEETKTFLQNTIHNPEMHSQLIAGLTSGRLSDKFTEMMVENNINTSKPDAMLAYYNMWVEEDFSEKVKSSGIETPIFVIVGKKDLPGFLEEHVKQTFGQWYQNLTVEAIDDAGHFPMYETPAYLAALMENFMREHIAD